MYPEVLNLTTYISHPLGMAGALIVAGFLITRLAFHSAPVARFSCQLVTFAGFTLMLIMAAVEPFKLTPAMDFTPTYVAISFFKITWWLAAAWLIAGFLRAVLVFKRQPFETRFLQDLFAGLCYIGAILGVIAYVFDIPVQGLLAASGVVAIVLGLALQSTLGDLFSGVVLNLAKPYRPGDWVILEGGTEGRVIETNWRATQILTVTQDIAIVPNSVIAKARLVNASQPTRAHGLNVTIRLDPTSSPGASLAVLETALLSCNKSLHAPAPVVTIKQLDAVALECDLAFFVASVEQGPGAQNEVFDRIFRHCVSAGIRLAPPAGSALALPVRTAVQDPVDVPRRILDRLPLFASLTEEERLALAPKLRKRTFKAGETLLELGVVAPALFILHSGVLAAVQLHSHGDVEIFRLAPGECFAQASVLTGAVTLFKVRAVTKSSVYEIDKDDIAPILKQRPAIAGELAQIMAGREAEGKARLAELDAGEEHSENLAERLGVRMKLAFGLS